MQIQEIANQRIKISPRSITVKDENGKTCGVVRDAYRYSDLPFRTQFEYRKQMRRGLPFSRVVLCDKQLYYLHDLKPYEFFEKYEKGNCWEEEGLKSLAEKDELKNKASETMTVIPCYIKE